MVTEGIIKIKPRHNVFFFVKLFSLRVFYNLEVAPSSLKYASNSGAVVS